MDKKLVIKYIVFRAVQEFNKFHDKPVNDKGFFDEANNFTLQKCLLLPYIITIANGNKNFFINGIFNQTFFPNLVESDKKVEVGTLVERKFQPYSAEDLGLEFNDKGFLVFNFVEEQFNFDFEQDLSKVDQLHYNINYSIKFFIEKRYNDFAVLNENILKKITFQNSAFEIIYNFFHGKQIDDQNLIEYFNGIAEESFYFTYYNAKIEEDIDSSQL